MEYYPRHIGRWLGRRPAWDVNASRTKAIWTVLAASDTSHLLRLPIADHIALCRISAVSDSVGTFPFDALHRWERLLGRLRGAVPVRCGLCTPRLVAAGARLGQVDLHRRLLYAVRRLGAGQRADQ